MCKSVSVVTVTLISNSRKFRTLHNETIYSLGKIQSSMQNIQHMSLHRLRKRCRSRALPCLEQHYERHSEPEQPLKDNDSQGVKGSRKAWFDHSGNIIS